MNPPETNDPLDTILQHENTYIADEGFTKRVIASLPRRQSPRWPRFLLFGAAIVGSVAAAFRVPWNALLELSGSGSFSFNFGVLLPWIMVCLVVSALAWAVLAAVQWDD